MHFQAHGVALEYWIPGLAFSLTAIWGLNSVPLEAHSTLLSLHTRASTTWSLMSSEDLMTGAANTKCSHAIKSTHTWQRQAGPTFHMVPGVLCHPQNTLSCIPSSCSKDHPSWNPRIPAHLASDGSGETCPPPSPHPTPLFRSQAPDGWVLL